MASPPWTNPWSPSSPADSDLANTLGIAIRTFKLDVAQRMGWQHIWNNSVNADGEHSNITIGVTTPAGMNANTEAFKAANFSLTGSAANAVVDLSGTWNTSGKPTGIKLNMTDTASDPNSLLMDLQVGGVSKFSVSKGGVISGIGSGITGLPNSAYTVGFGTVSSSLGSGSSVSGTAASDGFIIAEASTTDTTNDNYLILSTGTATVNQYIPHKSQNTPKVCGMIPVKKGTAWFVSVSTYGLGAAVDAVYFMSVT